MIEFGSLSKNKNFNENESLINIGKSTNEIKYFNQDLSPIKIDVKNEN